MAKVNMVNLTRRDKERNTIQTEAEASYTVFEMNGERYFQIDTYGTRGRKEQGKVSQVLQFDEESVKLLIKLLTTEFRF